MRIAADDPRMIEAYEGERIEVNAVASNTEPRFAFALDGEPLASGAFLWSGKQESKLVATLFFSEVNDGSYELHFRGSDGVQQLFRVTQEPGERLRTMAFKIRAIGHAATVPPRLYRCSLGHMSVHAGTCPFDGRELTPVGAR